MMSRQLRQAVPTLVVRVSMAAVAAVALGVGAGPALAAPTVSTAPASPATLAAPALPTGCTQSVATVTCKYTTTGEHQFAVPSGVTSVTATAVGGQGGADF